MEVKLSEVIAPSFFPIHAAIKANTFTHYWLKGGRGSTKSSFIAVEIVLGIMKDPEANAVVFRKVKDTLKTSVYEQIVWAINILGVRSFWNIPQSTMVLTYIPTGQKIVFKGADNPRKVKSIAWAKGYCKYLWYEELDEFGGMDEIRMINQSMLRGDDNFIVFYSYNPPKSSNNWVNAEAKLTRPDRLVHHSTYLDVPEKWLGKQFIIEAEHLKEVNETAYRHEYLGEEVGTGGEVFGNVTLRPISEEEINSFSVIRRGLDFGFAADPLAYVVDAYDRKNRRLYIFHELYKYGMSNRNVTKHIMEENINNDLVLADSAEPKSISEMAQYGLKIAGVKKGPDSVDYGIKFLQDLEAIIIDDARCPETAREFTMYELDRNAQGNFRDGFPDHDNHTIDGVRYSLNYDILKHREEEKKSKQKVNWKFEQDALDREAGPDWGTIIDYRG